jgi:Fe-S-cluster containining protein
MKSIAGPFSDWLELTRKAIDTGGVVDVPCGSCSACCCSGFFITVCMNETETLENIPGNLLKSIPGVRGTQYMECEPHGRCRLLREGLCSIYEYRPLSCRTFDCRIFAATGILPNRNEQSPINQRIKSWRFSYPTLRDRELQKSLHLAATYLLKVRETGLWEGSSENNRITALQAIMYMDKIEELLHSAQLVRTAIDRRVHE